ncbi:MAG: protein tyrosine phosphatase [Pseudomonadota bacterium]
MTHFLITPLSAVESHRHQADHMVSFCAPGKADEQPGGMAHHLILEFNDIDRPIHGLLEPQRHHVERYFETLSAWGRETPVLLHCWMGISRSTAAALAGAALFDPAQDMAVLAQRLRGLSPIATPNPLLIAHADAILGLEGRLVEAVKAIGRGADAYEGIPFTLVHAS